VYHAYDENIFNTKHVQNIIERKTVVFVGRLVENKGVKKIIHIAKKSKDYDFLIAGEGELQYIFNDKDILNITCLGYIHSKAELAKIYKKSKYLLLPSIKSGNWEELFGMVIPEAMACGCIPICSDHNGPRVILQGTILEKYLYIENSFVDLAVSDINKENENLKKKVMRQ
jgi:glycosyltransferase involved in cell wall biosynthesis